MKSTPKMRTPLRATNQTTESGNGPQEQIRCRAYELYEQRGRNDGHELDDWLEAEAEAAQQKRIAA